MPLEILMTADRSIVSLRCTGPPEIRARLYQNLARAIVTTSGPAGAVFEQEVARGPPQITIRPRSLLSLVYGTGAVRTITQESAAPAPFDPPPGRRDRSGGLLLSRSCSETTDRPPPEVPSGAVVLQPVEGAWIGVQTYWLRAPEGALWLARRFRVATRDPSALEPVFRTTGLALARQWADALGLPCQPQALSRFRSRRDWSRRTVGALPDSAWTLRAPEPIPGPELPPPARHARCFPWERGHLCAFGASGAGKTTFLAEVAGSAIRRGRSVVALDLHGDLSIAIVSRLRRSERDRIVAVDVAQRPVPGIDVLARGPREGDDRSAAHLVAALKRLTPDGEAMYWGFRLERIFDTFVRLAQEQSGSLVDLADLLSNPDRRDAARLATQRPELASFLEELGPLLKRQPDFLWSAATRLSKITLVPELRELLAPSETAVSIDSVLADRRSLLIRLSFAQLGPEAAALAGTLLLARIYLGIAARSPGDGTGVPVLLLLDEAQGFSPPLLAEILTEGRKFGVRAIVSTQFPSRLGREARDAATGAVGAHLSFRVPRSGAVGTARWLGLPARDAPEQLATLPIGEGIAVDSGTGRSGSAVLVSNPPSPDPAAWLEIVRRTQRAYVGLSGPSEATPLGPDLASERLLLAILAASEQGRPLRPEEVVTRALELPGIPPDAAQLLDRWRQIEQRRWIERTEEGCRLTPSGERILGLGAPTGAVRETPEHRALLLAAFRIFARKGHRLELVRQGRFDTTLPDARLCLLADPLQRRPPSELAEAIDRARTGWAWRIFHGKNVHVEAEVSGALRRERIRHGLRKAARHDTFALFLVSDALRARRVRAVLREEGVGIDRAQVWTLSGCRVGSADDNR
ncbi:MAG: hypothetical protein WAN74_08440 [Thermoplasmata archaeon]